MEKEKLIKELHDDLEIVAEYRHVRLSYIIDSAFQLADRATKDKNGVSLYVSDDEEVVAKVALYTTDHYILKLSIYDEFKFELTSMSPANISITGVDCIRNYAIMDKKVFDRLVREVEATQ